MTETLEFRLPPLHQGLPTLAEIERGIEAVQATAVRILRDARLLFMARRYATSATLSATAITEIARIASLLELATARGETQAKASWRHFRKGEHSFPWAFMEPVAGPAAESDIDTLVRLLQLAGNRTECIAPGVWLSGDRVVRRGLAEELLKTAELVCRRKLDLRVVQIWIDVAKAQPRHADPETVLTAFRDALNAAGLPTIDILDDDSFDAAEDETPAA